MLWLIAEKVGTESSVPCLLRGRSGGRSGDRGRDREVVVVEQSSIVITH